MMSQTDFSVKVNGQNKKKKQINAQKNWHNFFTDCTERYKITYN